MSDWSAKNPYFTQITENFILNGEGSRKETRHIVFALGDSGLDYKVGDALGVIAENPPHIVEELLDVQGWDRDATVTTHNGERSLYDALKKDFEVHMANKKFVQSLAEKVVSSGMKISMSIVARTRNDASWAATDDQQILQAFARRCLPTTPLRRLRPSRRTPRPSKITFGPEITSTSCENSRSSTRPKNSSNWPTD